MNNQFFEDFVMVTLSSSWTFLEDEQKMSDESSMERSVDGNGGVCYLWQWTENSNGVY